MFFAVGVFHPKREVNVGTLWRSANAFGASFIFTVGPRFSPQGSDTMRSERHVPAFTFSDVDDLVAHLPHGCQLVGVELPEDAGGAGVWLPGFSHPKQACYLLGAEDHGLPPEVVARCHRVVAIPHATQCLNVAVAGSVVLYDRAVKAAKP